PPRPPPPFAWWGRYAAMNAPASMHGSGLPTPFVWTWLTFAPPPPPPEPPRRKPFSGVSLRLFGAAVGGSRPAFVESPPEVSGGVFESPCDATGVTATA